MWSVNENALDKQCKQSHTQHVAGALEAGLAGGPTNPSRCTGAADHDRHDSCFYKGLTGVRGLNVETL